MGEHLPCKQGVMSSNLTISIKTSEGNDFSSLSEALRIFNGSGKVLNIENCIKNKIKNITLKE